MNTEEAIEKILEIPEWMPKEGVVDYAVVGGCPRDMIMGKEIRDVDIAVRITGATSLRPSFESRMLKMGFKKVGGGYGSKFKVLESGFKVYNVMYMTETDPWQYVERQFDFGICMSLLDMEGRLWVNNAFLIDRDCKEITLYPFDRDLTTYQVGCAIHRHLDKLQKKFPTHEFNISHATHPTWFKLRKYEEWV